MSKTPGSKRPARVAATPPAAEVLGVDHIYLAVRSLEQAEAFYDRALLRVLGFRKSTFTLAGAPHVNYFNRVFGIVLRPANADTAAHDAYAPGLHHLCLRVAGQSDVDRAAKGLRDAGIEVELPRLFPEYAPDYYAVFFHDPDGVRLELTNFRAERKHRMDHWTATEDD
jgi:catechol 2,3-dioxygenase-like lactoylglutathione lyase family enzyme